LKTTPSGVQVVTFSVAVNRSYKGKDGEAQADFISVTAWRGTAEFISKYFKKGSSICIVGAIQTRNWTDAQGVKRYATEVVADEASFVDSKAESSAQYVNSDASAYVPEQYQAANFEAVEKDDDLPF
jgi:single-strand DNA-binding protein